jgi:hypothetical protein
MTGDTTAETDEGRDPELYRQAAALLEPGDMTLHGAVVHTDLTGDEESAMYETTLAVGDIIAGHVDAGQTYVYSGNDDPEFGLNQHQGRTLDGEEFVWECQQPLRDGTFDVVIYWKAVDPETHEAILADIRAAGYDAVGITADGRR